jgi:Kae1-associated kinase Bud32
MDLKVIVKRRIRKAYRIPVLDRKIRVSRTVHEALILNEAKKAGVPTPILYFLDRRRSQLVLQHVEGIRLKEALDQEKDKDRIEKLGFKLGILVGQLHVKGIIHGDLTTSNVILTSKDEMVLLDFGLAFHSDNVEDQGVDLHLLRQVLESHHLGWAKIFFEALMKGYRKTVGLEKALKVEAKLREIRARGRYIPPEERVTL